MLRALFSCPLPIDAQPLVADLMPPGRQRELVRYDKFEPLLLARCLPRQNDRIVGCHRAAPPRFRHLRFSDFARVFWPSRDGRCERNLFMRVFVWARTALRPPSAMRSHSSGQSTNTPCRMHRWRSSGFPSYSKARLVALVGAFHPLAWELIDNPPVTIAGAAALLSYADALNLPEDWEAALHNSLARALLSLSVQSWLAAKQPKVPPHATIVQSYPTGSPMRAKTIGIVLVAAMAALAAGVPTARITSTGSAASSATSKWKPLGFSRGVAILDDDVSSIVVATLVQPTQDRIVRMEQMGRGSLVREITYSRELPYWLRADRERQRNCGTGEQRDELPPS
jgi:hypothetical protein